MIIVPGRVHNRFSLVPLNADGEETKPRKVSLTRIALEHLAICLDLSCTLAVLRTGLDTTGLD